MLYLWPTTEFFGKKGKNLMHKNRRFRFRKKILSGLPIVANAHVAVPMVIICSITYGGRVVVCEHALCSGVGDDRCRCDQCRWCGMHVLGDAHISNGACNQKDQHG